MNKKPTFLGIGAPRAGTTWLFRVLSNHPDIWMPPNKELHFFDRNLNYPSPNDLATSSPIARALGSQAWERSKMLSDLQLISENLRLRKWSQAQWYCKWTFGFYDENWYVGLFPSVESYKISGEITPAYSILTQEDVALIKAINPHIKLIFIVRNPMEKAWSAITFNISKGFWETSLDSEEEIIGQIKGQAMLRRFKFEVQQGLLSEGTLLRKGFDSQGIFWACD